MHAPTENFSPALSVPAVRDLAWACFTPALLHSAHLPCNHKIANCSLTLTPARREWLQRLDRDPQDLIAHLKTQPSPRLGLYFESLWQFFLQRDSEVTLLAHNLPVRDGKRTVGEFDCLYYCHQRQRPVHLELAVKFYLQFSAGNGAGACGARWLGPNARDRLDLKLKRLLQHQIALSRHPSGVATLAALGVTKPLLEVELKGRLYRPVGKAPPPVGVNHAAAMHDWCRASDLAMLPDSPDIRYSPLQRTQWFAPITGAGGPWQRHRDLCVSLNTGCLTRPLQVAVLNAAGSEQKRLFVVPDHWPSQGE